MKDRLPPDPPTKNFSYRLVSSYFFIILSKNNDINVFRGYFIINIILIKILRKTSFVFDNISGTVEVDKYVDTQLESLPLRESEKKINFEKYCSVAEISRFL